MTARIYINIEADTAAEARQQMIGLLGDSYKIDTGWRDPVWGGQSDATPYSAMAAASAQAMAAAMEDTTNEVLADEGPNYAAMKAAHDAATEAPKRERGKPAPGRARRTKEEIAEDEAADKAEASAPAAEDAPLISTGEERIDPTTDEDAAQDAADEAAEVEATKEPELTHDDVRAALQKYLTAYGTPAAMEDGPKVLTMLFGAEVTKVSAVPGDQASLAKAVAGIDEMTTKNPFKRKVDL